jgi:hypothetical protein
MMFSQCLWRPCVRTPGAEILVKRTLILLNLSISRRKDVFAMADWLRSELESLGATVEKRPLGKQMLDGVELDLPPALLGQLGNDPKKVCYVFP